MSGTAIKITNLTKVCDEIKRKVKKALWLENMGHPNLAKMIMDEKRFPSAQPYTIHSDGRLWVTVDDIDKVNAVVVDESKSKFCKQFYIDAQPEITRCKDCKYYDSKTHKCEPLRLITCDDFWCKQAERK